MKITPLDIEKMEFAAAVFGGYKKSEVKTFLNDIASELSEIIQENAGYKEKIKELSKTQENYHSMEKKLQSTLMVIEDLKSSIQTNAQKQADNLINETKLQCNIMINEAEKKVSELKKELESFELSKSKLISKLKIFLKDELINIENFENLNTSNSNENIAE
jgi:cell division initiation protein